MLPQISSDMGRQNPHIRQPRLGLRGPGMKFDLAEFRIGPCNQVRPILHINGRSRFETQAVRNDGSGSRKGKQVDRIATRRSDAREGNNRLETGFAVAGEPRFRFPKGASCNIRRRLFLARLSATRRNSEIERDVLVEENRV
jgi:hypothetical protein